jgi:NSS family neurotransmitter:Na+ symporter
MQILLDAMSQIFFSLSVSMGIMITYGSYVKPEVNLGKSINQIEIFDTVIAFLAGLMVIPSVFFLNGGETPEFNSGPGLMFVTLPRVFDSMVGGAIIGVVFFVLVFFAALTSSISLMETVVSIICDKTHLSRRTVCFIVLAGSVLLGIPSCLGFGPLDWISWGGNTILDMFDILTNNVLMPIVALLTCIFVGYILKPQSLTEEMEIGGRFRSKKMFEIVIKYFAPICIVLILISSLLNVLGIVKI